MCREQGAETFERVVELFKECDGRLSANKRRAEEIAASRASAVPAAKKRAAGVAPTVGVPWHLKLSADLANTAVECHALDGEGRKRDTWPRHARHSRETTHSHECFSTGPTHLRAFSEPSRNLPVLVPRGLTAAPRLLFSPPLLVSTTALTVAALAAPQALWRWSRAGFVRWMSWLYLLLQRQLQGRQQRRCHSNKQ